MTRIPTLDTQLARMKSLLQAMCDRVITGFNVVLAQMEQPQQNTANLIKTILLDTEVDNLESEVDEAILLIFATQQPLAYELRLVYACAKITHHIERIGDAVESLARQLAGRSLLVHHEVVTEMMLETRNIFQRVYKAMFEGDLSQISDIHLLDDKIDSLHRELYQIAKRILTASHDSSKGSDDSVAAALQLINMSTKLEKIADLCCNWAEQIDFAENGMGRRTLKKRKHRVVFLDNEYGAVASLSASFLHEKLDDLFDLGVLTKSAKVKTTELNFSSFYENEKITPQIFPIANLHSTRWNRVVILICLGDANLLPWEDEIVPYKIVRMHWPEVTLGLQHTSFCDAQPFLELSATQLQNFSAALKGKVEEISHILARTRKD